MLLTKTSFRDYLKEEFQQRCEVNSSYSLRAFSRDLRLSPASLSEIFNGRQGMSVSRAQQVVERLNLSEDEKDVFCQLVEAEHGRCDIKRKVAKAKLQQRLARPYLEVQKNILDVLTNWYYFAILELTHIKGFQANVSWTAQQLNISELQVEEAVDKMQRVGLLEIVDDRWIDTENFFATPSDIPSQKIKQLHLQLLQKAEQAVVEQSVDERDFSSVIMAFDQGDMPKIKNKIKEFRQSLNKYISKSENKNSVYSLNIHFLKLTNSKEYR